MSVLVEGFGRDAVAMARLLAAEGAAVRLAGPGEPPAEAVSLQDVGVTVSGHADLDADPGDPAVAYLDVWTPEVAPRVARLRAAGACVSCIGDLVLQRAPVPVVGVTGTAGKTTTTALLAHLLRSVGIPVLASDAAANANMWPSADHLAGLAGLPPGARVVVELTSSHLAFMASSPEVAVVTTFWPDHLELHGSLAAYRAAKETIVRHQRPDDVVVVDLAEPEVARFAGVTPARRLPFGSRPAEGAVAWLEGGAVVLEGDGARRRAALPPAAVFRGTRAVNAVAACAAALAAGVPAEAVAAALASAPAPPFRARSLGRVAGVEVVDDGMAATPAKALASLRELADRSVVLICGGDDRLPGAAVHATPLERAALRRACDEAARVARAAVAFGPAAGRLLPLLRERGVEPVEAESLDEAVALALALAPGAAALVFAPMFPVAAADRARFAAAFGLQAESPCRE